MNLVSVIVPVYNVEEHLSKCLESVLNQEYSNIELILVNDGSTDRSLEICFKYSEKDSRVVVVNKDNEGAGAARNAGLEVATGDFVLFVDSDDWIEPNMLTLLLEPLLKEENTDLSVCSYYIEDINGNGSTIVDFNTNEKYTTMTDIKQVVALLEERRIFPYLWNRIYRRDIVEKYFVRFENQFTTGQDLDFNFKYFRHVKNVSIIDVPLYHYIKNGTNSLCARYKKNLYQIVTELSRRRKAFYQDLDMMEDTAVKRIYSDLYTSYLSICIPNMFRENAHLTYQDRCELMKELLSDTELNECIDEYEPKNPIGKMFKKSVKHGNVKRAVKEYTILFAFRNNFDGLYKKIRKIAG